MNYEILLITCVNITYSLNTNILEISKKKKLLLVIKFVTKNCYFIKFVIKFVRVQKIFIGFSKKTLLLLLKYQ